MRKPVLLITLILLLAGALVIFGCKGRQEEAETTANSPQAQAEEAPALDYSKPEVVLMAYFDAWTKGDVEGVMATTVKGLEVKPENRDALAQEYLAKMKSPLLTDLKVISSQINDNLAVFELSLKADGTEGQFPAYAVKIKDKWYVDERKAQ